MKKIYDIVSMAILLFCTAACSDSYLELSPESSVSDEVIFENADAAQYAVNGLGRIMSTQYLDTQGTTEKVPFMRIRANILEM